MELVAATLITPDLVEITLGDAAGLISLSATTLETTALCDAMEQAAVLARASARTAWLATLRAGEAIVHLGIHRGRVRVVVGPGT
jgi:hypothetical protein